MAKSTAQACVPPDANSCLQCSVIAQHVARAILIFSLVLPLRIALIAGQLWAHSRNRTANRRRNRNCRCTRTSRAIASPCLRCRSLLALCLFLVTVWYQLNRVQPRRHLARLDVQKRWSNVEHKGPIAIGIWRQAVH